jgi:hypothetical protein
MTPKKVLTPTLVPAVALIGFAFCFGIVPGVNACFVALLGLFINSMLLRKRSPFRGHDGKKDTFKFINLVFYTFLGIGYSFSILAVALPALLPTVFEFLNKHSYIRSNDIVGQLILGKKAWDTRLAERCAPYRDISVLVVIEYVAGVGQLLLARMGHVEHLMRVRLSQFWTRKPEQSIERSTLTWFLLVTFCGGLLGVSLYVIAFGDSPAVRRTIESGGGQFGMIITSVIWTCFVWLLVEFECMLTVRQMIQRD